MRDLRRGVLAFLSFGVFAAAPAAHAQQERLFQNAWFWGVHAGGTSVGTPVSPSSGATTVGAEWMITRSRGGLYVAYDQANFTRTSSIADPSSATGTQRVRIHDMRSGSIAGVVFPFEANGFRPYAGLGFALNVIGSATPIAGASSVPVTTDVSSRIEDARSQSSVFAMGGVQLQLRRTAVFGQFTAAPSQSAFLISRPLTSITAGVRYNFGSSIEQ
jgi:hypothetical protein